MSYNIYNIFNRSQKILVLTAQEMDKFIQTLKKEERYLLKEHIKLRKQNSLDKNNIDVFLIDNELKCLYKIFDDKFYSNLESVLK